MGFRVFSTPVQLFKIQSSALFLRFITYNYLYKVEKFLHFLLGPQTEARVLSQFVVQRLQLIVKQGVLCKLLGKCIIVKVRFVNTGLWQTLFTVRVALII